MEQLCAEGDLHGSTDDDTLISRRLTWWGKAALLCFYASSHRGSRTSSMGLLRFSVCPALSCRCMAFWLPIEPQASLEPHGPAIQLRLNCRALDGAQNSRFPARTTFHLDPASRLSVIALTSMLVGKKCEWLTWCRSCLSALAASF